MDQVVRPSNRMVNMESTVNEEIEPWRGHMMIMENPENANRKLFPLHIEVNWIVVGTKHWR